MQTPTTTPFKNWNGASVKDLGQKFIAVNGNAKHLDDEKPINSRQTPIKLYSSLDLWDNYHLLCLDDIESTSEQIKKLRKIIDIIHKSKNKELISKIFNYISRLSESSFSIEEFNIESIDFDTLTHYSKKKAILYHLKKKWYSKDEIKELISDILNINSIDDDIFDHIHGAFVDQSLINIIDTYTDISDENIARIYNSFLNSLAPEYQERFIKLLKLWNSPQEIISMFEKWISNDSGIAIIKDWEAWSSDNIKQLEYLEKISSTERIGISDFNPILLDLDLETGMKLFGLDRLKEIYRNFFRVISGEIVQKFSWTMPIFDQIIFSETNKEPVVN